VHIFDPESSSEGSEKKTIDSFSFFFFRPKK